MSSAAPSARRVLLRLCLASAGWAFSFGVGGTLAPLWLQQAGAGQTSIGLNTSAYYLGVAVAAPLAPWLMRRSARACVVGGVVADGLLTALFPWGGSLLAWGVLRCLAGIATALSLIPMETLVNHNAAPGHRARDFGLYACCVALGIGLGAAAGLQLYPLGPRLAFVVGGVVTLAAALLVIGELPWEKTAAEGGADAPLSGRDHFLSFGTAWAQGFLEGGMLTFLSLYLLSLGYDEPQAGFLMGGLFAGVVLAQVPLAMLADRLGRLRILLACHALLLAGLIALPLCRGPLGLGVWLFALGASCGALYPLGLALLGDRVPEASLARANAWYLASNCAGSLSGPVLMGLAIDLFGRLAQFAAAALSVVLVVAGSFVLRRARGAGPACRFAKRQANSNLAA
jgi:MFS family permease